MVVWWKLQNFAKSENRGPLSFLPGEHASILGGVHAAGLVAAACTDSGWSPSCVRSAGTRAEKRGAA